MVAQLCCFQKGYGKTPDQITSLIESYALFLAEYKIYQIEFALKAYIKQKPDIPAPANLIKIIEERYQKESPTPNTSDFYKNMEIKRENAMKIARDYCYGLMEKPDGIKALNECYYTEMFNHLYKQAFSQAMQNNAPYAQLPDIIPQAWLDIGWFRKKVRDNRWSSNSGIRPEIKAPEAKTRLDLEIDRQLNF